MRYLDHSFLKPEENLAADEVLLEAAEKGQTGEMLRFWEAKTVFVVVGYSNRVDQEVKKSNCESEGIPIFRRSSGGGAVLQAPGCLNFALVLRIPESGPLSTITGANREIMEKNAQALQPLVDREIKVEGHTDLTLGAFKFSGNSQRRRRQYLLFHGTFLIDMKLDLLEQFLESPTREPDYRQKRRHLEFVTNVPISAWQIRQALQTAWNAREAAPWEWQAELEQLAAQKFLNKEWNYKF